MTQKKKEDMHDSDTKKRQREGKRGENTLKPYS